MAYTDGYSASPKSVPSRVGKARYTTAGYVRPILRPTLKGFQRGPNTYTQEEVDNLLALGIKAKRLKKRRERRRDRVWGDLEKVKKDLEKVKKDIEEMSKEDMMELNELIDDDMMMRSS